LGQLTAVLWVEAIDHAKVGFGHECLNNFAAVHSIHVILSFHAHDFKRIIFEQSLTGLPYQATSCASKHALQVCGIKTDPAVTTILS